MMTRKDYQLIALHLNRELARIKHTSGATVADRDSVRNEQVGIVRAVSAVANALASDNPRFDRDRFLTACGVE